MDINSAVKRNNPVWDANTVQVTMTIPVGTWIDLDPRGTYVMITNPAGANLTLFDTRSVLSGALAPTTGIILSAGATFECAINLSPGTTANIRVVGAAAQEFTVTYFS